MTTPPAAGPGNPERLEPTIRASLHAVLHGDQRALDALLAACWESVVNYAASITGGFDSAEDVAQETFLRIWSHRSVWQSRGEASIGLIYRIARNLALNHVRAGTRRERHLSLYREAQQAQQVLEPVWPGAFQLRAAVEAAVAELSPRRREVFTLARYHGLSYAEIAETMGISQQTVANHMSAALDALRHSLASFDDAPQAERTLSSAAD